MRLYMMRRATLFDEAHAPVTQRRTPLWHRGARPCDTEAHASVSQSSLCLLYRPPEMHPYCILFDSCFLDKMDLHCMSSFYVFAYLFISWHHFLVVYFYYHLGCYLAYYLFWSLLLWLYSKGCNHFSSLFFVWFIVLIMDVWMLQTSKIAWKWTNNQTWTKLLKLKIVWIKMAIRM